MASPVVGTGYNFKVVLLGEGCVGKTSVALRYVEDKFNDKHITTLQVTPSPYHLLSASSVSYQVDLVRITVFAHVKPFFFWKLFFNSDSNMYLRKGKTVS